jgi:hypothetical protein
MGIAGRTINGRRVAAARENQRMKCTPTLTWENRWVVVLGAALLLLPQAAFGVVPVVKTVPWVATNVSIPHDTYAAAVITLKGTTNQQAANFQFNWDFGDGSAHAIGTVTNQFDVEATHTYVGAVGTIWTAQLTITDTNTSESASTGYKVEMRDNNLTSNVNVAIDEGLWYLHKTMHRYTGGPFDLGDWFSGCAGFACQATWGLTATNIQAFEVNGHLEGGPSSDPYTDDVARGLKALFANMQTFGISSFTVTGGCASPPCTINPDGNGNGIATRIASGNPNYETGMIIDAVVASGTPGALAVTGPVGVTGKTYKDVTQDMVDQYEFCVVRNNTGGGWRYGCPDGVGDGSVSQWAAIGIIAAQRGFGVVVDPILIAWNKVWVANSQDSASGEFGYVNASPVWGPYATTPSGMVQMAMDQIGRGNTQWDKAESFIRDNFGNTPTDNTTSIKAYYYGMFSFTKSMLLHDPGGVLTPITLLQSQTAGVNPIDWYSAEVSKGAPTDGVARWLVSQQNPTGYWYNTTEVFTSQQWPFSTGFAVIMLRRTVFTACITDLVGKGTPSGRAAARIDLTWTAVTGADHYIALRSSTSGGPYAPVGTSTVPAYSDRTGLVNGKTYYYVMQPATTTGGAICQSNEAAVTIPAQGR